MIVYIPGCLDSIDTGTVVKLFHPKNRSTTFTMGREHPGYLSRIVALDGPITHYSFDINEKFKEPLPMLDLSLFDVAPITDKPAATMIAPPPAAPLPENINFRCTFVPVVSLDPPPAAPLLDLTEFAPLLDMSAFATGSGCPNCGRHPGDREYCDWQECPGGPILLPPVTLTGNFPQGSPADILADVHAAAAQIERRSTPTVPYPMPSNDEPPIAAAFEGAEHSIWYGWPTHKPAHTGYFETRQRVLPGGGEFSAFTYYNAEKQEFNYDRRMCQLFAWRGLTEAGLRFLEIGQ